MIISLKFGFKSEIENIYGFHTIQIEKKKLFLQM